MSHPPRFPERLPGTLWGVAAYFNPIGYRSRRENFRTFREHSGRQGLQLIVVECALEGQPFELRDDDAEQVIRVRSDAVLWQKERLLNIGFAQLPDDCDKVVWLDADIRFTDDDWIDGVSRSLESFIVVQPFCEVIQLPAPHPGAADARSLAGVSSAFLWASAPDSFRMSGRPGFAMAARRSLVDRYGLYDRMILGGGDSLFIGACVGMSMRANGFTAHETASLRDHSETWTSAVGQAAQGSVSFYDQVCIHAWHGDPANRFYGQRGRILRDFDCVADIAHDPGGPWRWTTDKPDLHRDVRAYFAVRDEDGRGGFDENAHRMKERLAAAA